MPRQRRPASSPARRWRRPRPIRLRHLVMRRDDAVTEQSLIMKNKDEKGDKPERRRRDDESDSAVGTGESDNAEAA